MTTSTSSPEGGALPGTPSFPTSVLNLRTAANREGGAVVTDFHLQI